MQNVTPYNLLCTVHSYRHFDVQRRKRLLFCRSSMITKIHILFPSHHENVTMARCTRSIWLALLKWNVCKLYILAPFPIQVCLRVYEHRFVQNAFQYIVADVCACVCAVCAQCAVHEMKQVVQNIKSHCINHCMHRNYNEIPICIFNWPFIYKIYMCYVACFCLCFLSLSLSC